MTNTRRDIYVYPAADRPDVEVLVDDDWLVGEGRMRWQDERDGAWWYQIQWRPKGSNTRRLDNFPADRLRDVH